MKKILLLLFTLVSLSASAQFRVVQTGLTSIEVTAITDNQTIGTTLSDIVGSEFTLPTVGTWTVIVTLFTGINTVGSNFSAFITTAGNVGVNQSTGGNSSQSGGAATNSAFTITARITTTTANEVFKVRGVTSAGNTTIHNNSALGINAGNSKILAFK